MVNSLSAIIENIERRRSNHDILGYIFLYQIDLVLNIMISNNMTRFPRARVVIKDILPTYFMYNVGIFRELGLALKIHSLITIITYKH